MPSQISPGPSNVPIFVPMANRKFKPKGIVYAKLGMARNEKRFWLEGWPCNFANMVKNTPLRYTAVPELYAFVLETCKAAQATHTVSGRKRAGTDEYKPIIDINNKEISALMEGIDTVRVMCYQDRLLIQAHSNDLNAMTAIEDLEINTKARKLTMGVIGVGGGVFSSAIKEGFEKTGIDLETSWVIDIENKYLESLIKNTETVTDATIVVEGDASDVEVNLLTPINVFLISNACTGLSSAGKAKNQLDHAEEHAKSGLMILKTLEIIEKYLPPVIWHENVMEFNTSASAALFSGKLKQLGYNIQYGRYGGEMGTLEERPRSIICATHKSLKFDMAHHLLPVMQKEARLKDVLDDVRLDDPMWKTFDYLKEKEIRDKADGKGFLQQILTGEENKVPVVRAGYHKGGSSDPRIQHPTDPELSRLLTVGEHARVMKIPEPIVEGLSDTVAHQILGQSGSYALVKAIGVFTGKELNAHFNDEPMVLDQSFMQEDIDLNMNFEMPSILDDDELDALEEEMMAESKSNQTMSLF